MSLLLPLLLACATTGGSSNLVEQLDREIIALRKRNEALHAQLQSCSEGELDTEIYAELTQVFSGSEVQVSRAGARTVVVIPGELLFAPGSTSVREESAMVLDLLAVALRIHADTQVQVIGHTDDDPLTGTLRRKYGDNWGLSTARAHAFMLKLVDDFGVEADRFTIAGRGPSEPVVSNDTPEGRARNRRIVVVVGPAEQLR